MGRPTKYKGEEHVRLIEEKLSQGFSVTAVLHYFDVSKDTLYKWKQKYSEFSDAWDRGYSKGLMMFEELTIKHAKGDRKINYGPIAFIKARRYSAEYAEKKEVEQKIEHDHVFNIVEYDISNTEETERD